MNKYQADLKVRKKNAYARLFEKQRLERLSQQPRRPLESSSNGAQDPLNRALERLSRRGMKTDRQPRLALSYSHQDETEEQLPSLEAAFADLSSLVVLDGSQERIRCPVAACRRSFLKQGSAEGHYEREHLHSRYRCHLCDCVFKRKYLFQFHVREMEGSNGHDWRSCDVCRSDPLLQDDSHPSPNAPSHAVQTVPPDRYADPAITAAGTLVSVEEQESRDAAASPPTERKEDEIHAAAVVLKQTAASEDLPSKQESGEEWQEREDVEDCSQDALLPLSSSPGSLTLTWDLMDDIFGPLPLRLP